MAPLTDSTPLLQVTDTDRGVMFREGAACFDLQLKSGPGSLIAVACGVLGFAEAGPGRVRAREILEAGGTDALVLSCRLLARAIELSIEPTKPTEPV